MKVANLNLENLGRDLKVIPVHKFLYCIMVLYGSFTSRKVTVRNPLSGTPSGGLRTSPGHTMSLISTFPPGKNFKSLFLLRF